jgi:hypothetical protein
MKMNSKHKSWDIKKYQTDVIRKEIDVFFYTLEQAEKFQVYCKNRGFLCWINSKLKKVTVKAADFLENERG